MTRLSKCLLILKGGSAALLLPHICWIDNYSKIYGDRFFTGDERPYSLPLWTAYAIRPIPSVSEEMLSRCADALPDHPFSHLKDLIDLMSELDHIEIDAIKPHRCVAIKMYNIPPGPGISDSIESISFWKHRKDTTMKTLLPWKIQKDNVASNDVLLGILKNELEPSAARPKWILADINIFSRALRVSALCLLLSCIDGI